MLKTAAINDDASPDSKEFEEDTLYNQDYGQKGKENKKGVYKPITEVDEEQSMDTSMMNQQSSKKASIQIANQLIESIGTDYQKNAEVTKKLDKVIDLLTSIKSQRRL